MSLLVLSASAADETGPGPHFWSMAPRGPVCLGSHSGFPESFAASSNVDRAFPLIHPAVAAARIWRAGAPLARPAVRP